jgi:hypothetical protein
MGQRRPRRCPPVCVKIAVASVTHARFLAIPSPPCPVSTAKSLSMLPGLPFGTPWCVKKNGTAGTPFSTTATPTCRFAPAVKFFSPCAALKGKTKPNFSLAFSSFIPTTACSGSPPAPASRASTSFNWRMSAPTAPNTFTRSASRVCCPVSFYLSFAATKRRAFVVWPSSPNATLNTTTGGSGRAIAPRPRSIAPWPRKAPQRSPLELCTEPVTI